MADKKTKPKTWSVRRTAREDGHNPDALERLLNELDTQGLQVFSIIPDAHCFVVVIKA